MVRLLQLEEGQRQGGMIGDENVTGNSAMPLPGKIQKAGKTSKSIEFTVIPRAALYFIWFPSEMPS